MHFKRFSIDCLKHRKKIAVKYECLSKTSIFDSICLWEDDGRVDKSLIKFKVFNQLSGKLDKLS